MKIPRIITEVHLQKRILFKAKTALSEGLVQELSRDGSYVRVSGKWFHNEPGLVLDMLPALPEPKANPRRSSPIKGK